MGKKKSVPETPSPVFRNNPFASLQGLDVPKASASETEDHTALAAPVSSKNQKEEAFSWPAKITLRRQKKGRGGKTVTHVSGLSASARETLYKRMKKALGCGATLEGDDIVLLGSLVDRAADWLEEEGAPNVVRAN